MDGLAQILGASSISDVILISLVLGGGGGFLTGQGQAQGWASPWKVVPFVLLLACGTRFLHYALFEGTLLSLTGFLVDLVWIGLCATAAYRMTRAAKMVRQYPWLYERAGLFGWRERSGAAR